MKIKLDKNSSQKRYVKGFTLIETLVTVFMFAFVLFIIVTAYVNGIKTFREKNLERDLVFETQKNLNEISRNAKKASEIIESISLNSIDYVSDSENIILRVPSLDDNNETLYQAGEILDYDYIIYQYSNEDKNIKRSIYPDESSSRELSEDSVIQANVSELNLEYLPTNPPSDWNDVESIKIDIQATKTNGNITKQISLNKIIRPRN